MYLDTLRPYLCDTHLLQIRVHRRLNPFCVLVEGSGEVEGKVNIYLVWSLLIPTFWVMMDATAPGELHITWKIQLHFILVESKWISFRPNHCRISFNFKSSPVQSSPVTYQYVPKRAIKAGLHRDWSKSEHNSHSRDIGDSWLSPQLEQVTVSGKLKTETYRIAAVPGHNFFGPEDPDFLLQFFSLSFGFLLPSTFSATAILIWTQPFYSSIFS